MTKQIEDTTTTPIDPEEALETVQDEVWERVKAALENAAGAAWDECHKIYIMMDAEQVARMRELDYPVLIDSQNQMSNDELLETIENWFSWSCMLRFIQAVRTVADGADPNTGYEDLIEQFHPAFNDMD